MSEIFQCVQNFLTEKCFPIFPFFWVQVVTPNLLHYCNDNSAMEAAILFSLKFIGDVIKITLRSNPFLDWLMLTGMGLLYCEIHKCSFLGFSKPGVWEPGPLAPKILMEVVYEHIGCYVAISRDLCSFLCVVSGTPCN